MDAGIFEIFCFDSLKCFIFLILFLRALNVINEYKPCVINIILFKDRSKFQNIM